MNAKVDTNLKLVDEERRVSRVPRIVLALVHRM